MWSIRIFLQFLLVCNFYSWANCSAQLLTEVDSCRAVFLVSGLRLPGFYIGFLDRAQTSTEREARRSLYRLPTAVDMFCVH